MATSRWPTNRLWALAINASSRSADRGKSMPSDRICGLYGITPDQASAAALEAAVNAALAGGVNILQYRSKLLSGAMKRQQARHIRTICRESGVTFIVNDDVGLAAEIDADGVHLGREDGSLQSARQVLGPQKIIGFSCYNDLSLARVAADGGADYIAFGSFFPSPTKPAAVQAQISLIAQAKQRFTIPIVAIGGITLKNAPQLIEAGADAVAVLSDLFGAVDIAAQASSYRKLFDHHVRQKQTTV